MKPTQKRTFLTSTLKGLRLEGMEAVIEDIKERKYNTAEYLLDDESGAKAVECIPISAVDGKERTKVLALDDLNVSPHIYILTCQLKKRVHETFNKKLKPIQRSLASVIFDGKDLLYPIASYQNIQQIREVYLLHAINQIYKYSTLGIL